MSRWRKPAIDRADRAIPCFSRSASASRAACASRAPESPRARSRASSRRPFASSPANDPSRRRKARHRFIARRKSCTASASGLAGSSIAACASARMWRTTPRNASPTAASDCKTGLSSMRPELYPIGHHDDNPGRGLFKPGHDCYIILARGLLRAFRFRWFDAGWSSPVARQAHNLKVVGSNPTPATIKNVPPSPEEAAVVFCWANART